MIAPTVYPACESDDFTGGGAARFAAGHVSIHLAVPLVRLLNPVMGNSRLWLCAWGRNNPDPYETSFGEGTGWPDPYGSPSGRVPPWEREFEARGSNRDTSDQAVGSARDTRIIFARSPGMKGHNPNSSVLL